MVIVLSEPPLTKVDQGRRARASKPSRTIGDLGGRGTSRTNAPRCAINIQGYRPAPGVIVPVRPWTTEMDGWVDGWVGESRVVVHGIILYYVYVQDKKKKKVVPLLGVHPWLIYTTKSVNIQHVLLAVLKYQ